MDWPQIGKWAGDQGPLIGIIFAQWAIIWRLLNRFFAQQDMVMKALDLAKRSTDVAAEKLVIPEVRK